MRAINISFLLLSYLSVSHGWQCKQGPQQAGAAQIDAGQGQVVMRDGNSDVYFLSGSTWSRLGSVALKHVSVGPAGIWGVDSSDTVYKYVAGDFIPSVGQNLQQVDAGGDGQVVGVTGSDTIHCLDSAKTSGFKDVGSLSWNTIPGRLVYYSCSSHGCWGVNTNDNIYYTGISPETCVITGWIHVDGAAVMAEIGTDGTVFVVNAGGNLYQRTGISTSVPQGTGWTHIPMSETIKHATYDLGHLWLTTDTGAILECSSTGWYCKSGPQHSGAEQIDAGQGQVVMTDENSLVYFLSGSTWSRLGSVALKHVTVGPAGIWGVDDSDNVYKYAGGDFILSNGQQLNQVDAGGDGQVVGVTGSSSIHCLKSTLASAFHQAGSLSWDTIPGGLMYFSCSPSGCWGVNSGHNIYFTTVTPDTCGISGWTHVDGAAVMVEVGADGTVFVVNSSGNLYQRTGITAAAPQGTGWVHIPMSLTVKHATYDHGSLWLMSTAGLILECTQ